MSELEPRKRWHKAVFEQIRHGREMERFAESTQLPFEVRPHWPGLDWVEHGEELHSFTARVNKTSSVLGPPESVKGEHWLGAYSEDQPPDLIARWNVKMSWGTVEATVRALGPRGCKIDPRSTFKAAETPKLHPECAAALRELEEAKP